MFRFVLLFIYTLLAVAGLFKSGAPDTQKNLSIEKAFYTAAADFVKCDFSNESCAPLIQKLRRGNPLDGASTGNDYWIAQKIRLPIFDKSETLHVDAQNVSQFVSPNIRTYTVFLI